ncbi:hypothetical protein U1Q18_010916 [Sarracenia purpurea var. burkii]
MGSSESTQGSGRGENDPSNVGSAEDLARKKKNEEMVKIGAGVVAGAALVGSLIYGLASASGEKEEEGKEMMKAPRRRGSYIPRDDFTKDPGKWGGERDWGSNPEPRGAPKRSIPFRLEAFSGPDSRTLKILSYNVWFREDVEMHKRMKALSDLIQLHSPDLICFQEITPNIHKIFQQSSWWKVYRCSVSNEMAFTRPYFCMQLSKLPVKSYSCKPFSNSRMGRELCLAEAEVQVDKVLVVATSHLESPCPAPPKWDQRFSKERVDQAKEALNILKTKPNVIFCGDMNWDDELDGQFPLLDGWVDAWAQLRPGENGWTYDTKSNQMLSGNRTLQKRLDRFVCSLRDFKIRTIEIIGKEAIPGVSYCREKKVKNEVKQLVLPVLPSDHYGLLLTISSK